MRYVSFVIHNRIESSTPDGFPCRLVQSGANSELPREARLAKVSGRKGSFCGGDTYFLTATTVGEAFCRTISADTLKSWKSDAQLDDTIESSGRRLKSKFQIMPNRETLSSNKILLLSGWDVPFILRQIAEDHYVLVGEAYIHSAMDGHVMKGFGRMTEWRRTFKY